jgi:hypothetical protein
MSKQTAVEWFAEKVEQHLLTFGSIQPIVLSKFKQEAIAMQKEQIIKSMAIAFIDALKIQDGKESLYKDWEQYYTETYGGDK